MSWAIELFKQCGIDQVDITVVDGNDAIVFYEKFGFRIHSHILRINLEI